MSLNPRTRTECLETLLSPTEMTGFAGLCNLLGVSKSAHSRSLINNAVRTHGISQVPKGESRGCPGQGRMPSRASAVKGMVSARRNF
ncbi:hypothetical protein IP91_00099 [Pseudoduganella lurida]|uniref:Uncharacterized protein n=1 Tax=Pseudoduganella lurida TaxID=1036180 RepID=A0A562RKA6_9BURK|nr:hypothetical protein [Pseudoduganella lurida]TWI69034.1 hypothetical protein IP91_00099 [Pseudoduganella lurida]